MHLGLILLPVVKLSAWKQGMTYMDDDFRQIYRLCMKTCVLNLDTGEVILSAHSYQWKATVRYNIKPQSKLSFKPHEALVNFARQHFRSELKKHGFMIDQFYRIAPER